MKNVLLIGAGGVGKKHLLGFLATNRATVSVCEIDQEKLRTVAETCNLKQAYSSLESIPLNRFDLAVVAAPPDRHVSIGSRLAAAGVPFLLEKPLAVTLDGVDRLIEIVTSQRLLVRVGFLRRSLLHYRQLKLALDRGQIGHVHMAYLNASSHFPKYRPDYRSTYYAKVAMGGGAILDCASHFIDVVQWMLGPVSQVGAMYDRLALEGVEGEDALLLNLRLASGALVNLTVNQFQRPTAETVELVGSEANLRLTGTLEQLEQCCDDAAGWQVLWSGKQLAAQVEDEKSGGLFARQADQFLDALDGQPDNLCTLEEARSNLRVCLAAKASYATGRIVDLSENLNGTRGAAEQQSCAS